MRSTRVHAAAAATLVALAVLAGAPPCRAGNEATAEALFAEAKKLVAQKKYAEACEKFAESNKLDRGAGTLIHLANCYEKNKQTASAWATFKEAASAAQAINRADWQKLANERANKLEPKLARLVINVPDPVEKIDVKRDGAPMSQATWGMSIPVDVGEHTIEASAPGFKPYKTPLKISKDGEKAEIVVPKLEVDPAAATANKPPETKPNPHAVQTGGKDGDAWKRARTGQSRRTLGLIVGGVGILGLGAGAVTGIIALGKDSDSKRECPDDGACRSQAAIDANDSAKTLGTVSTIAFAVGGVAVIAGAVLYFTAPSGEQRAGRIRIVPSAGPQSAGLTIGGVF